MNNPTTPSTQKMRLYLRIAALFFFITAVIATFVVWGSIYTNDRPGYHDCVNNDIYYVPGYEHENNAEDVHYSIMREMTLRVMMLIRFHPNQLWMDSEYRTEFDVFFEVLRPAIAVGITDAETPSRQSIVYVW